MKRAIRISAIFILAVAIYSLLPVGALYIAKDAKSYTNTEAAERLKKNTGVHFEFIAFGDNHGGFIFNDSATLKLFRHINREGRFKKVPIDFVINLGDVTFAKGTEWDYRVYNKLRALSKYPVISVAGNHDDGPNRRDLTNFKKHVGNAEFSFVDRNSYFIVFDNRLGDLSNSQFARLEEELKKSKIYSHRFIFMHKAPLSPYQQSWYRPELNPWSYRFMKLCEEYKVDMVMSGHEHIFRSAKYGGVKYITSGGGGMPILIPEADGGFLHYVVVRVYGDYVDYEVRKIFPPLWEFLAYYMWKELFYILRGAVF